MALVLIAGCSTSKASPQGTGDPVFSYTDAPSAARTLLDRSGMEPEVEQAGARLAVGKHVVVVGDVDDSALSQMAHIGDAAVVEVERLDGRTARGRVLILAPETQSDFDSWGGAGYDDVDGVTQPPAADEGHGFITLDLAQSGWASATMAEDPHLLRRVITHEMFHAVTLPVGGGSAPQWLTEGFAEVAGAQMGGAPQWEVVWHASLPTDEEFHSNPQNAYFLAWQFTTYLQHHEGRERAMCFYFAALARHHHAPLSALSRRCFGASLHVLLRRWTRVYDANGPVGVY